ncbi:SOS response-associated peptidase [Flexithrix dorotheae]|uniref:SOS response-associated peptidase n=1 Tax=Flexithrix dorotheae TaxID=70993 RepID=UPI00038196C2|nr:SOS response-associated peptidase family protein [Flexithrix dorotheae]
MCGRYTITKKAEEIEKRFEARISAESFEKKWNAAPSNLLPIITNHEPQIIQQYKWGLIPGWAKDEAIGFNTINARVESVTEKPAFKFAFTKQRCLVLADGYYEWKKIGKEKIPYRITLDDGALFAMAGLWEKWTNPQGQITHSFSVITLPAPHKIAHIHDRMPAILSRINEQHWLENDLSDDERIELLQPPAEKYLGFYSVSKQVNSATNEGPDLIKPHNYSVQGSLF